MSVPGGNQVVVHGDAERMRDLDDGLRHLNICARRPRLSGVRHDPQDRQAQNPKDR
jgi:hypothetical protein